ncbi:MAG TPA: M23 family metallopeptidase [Gemmatimonadaceae bacterium]|nr:M23 family metallopeptidase [Gemmatimonadaceae bacterium]
MYKPFLLLAGIALLGACEVVSDDKPKQDTTTLTPDSAQLPATGAIGAESAGVPAVASDTTKAPADSGDVQLDPATPKRGGVVFALARGLVTNQSPRCSIDGQPLPCYQAPDGIVAVVPLPADEPAGSRRLVFEHPTRRTTRTIQVTEQDFGRELVFLDSARFALLSRQADIARDARAVRQILALETPERKWTGSWRNIMAAGRTSLYGVERFYYRASDSTRAVTLSPSMRVRGAFAADTSAPAAGDVPAWRHTGVDIPLANRARIRPPAAGTVTKVGDYVLTGRTVLVDHGQGVSTAYFHLDTVLVSEGDQVTGQTVLGRVGTTGLTTGPHLHYGVYIHGKDVDPVAWHAMPDWYRRGQVASQ